MSGLVRAERLFRARRRARRRRAARPALVAAILTTVAGGSVWVAYDSPLLRLSSVSVKGTSRLVPADVIAAAGVRTGGSLLSIDTDLVRRRVERLAAVAAVQVARAWPHGIVVTVSERVPVAAVATGAGTDATVTLLDAQGVAFAAAADSPPGQSSSALLDLRVVPPTLGASSPASSAALRVWSALPPATRQQVRWMSADSADDVTLRLTHLPGNREATVVWGSAQDCPAKLAVLGALMRRPASTYDVSTPGIAVTR